jgi:hypothetical protein
LTSPASFLRKKKLGKKNEIMPCAAARRLLTALTSFLQSKKEVSKKKTSAENDEESCFIFASIGWRLSG